MATCRQIITAALRKTGDIEQSETPEGPQENAGLASLQALYESWAMAAPLHDVLVGSDYQAGEFERVTSLETINATLPATVRGLDGRWRAPLDGAVVVFALGEPFQIYIYSALSADWIQLTELALESTAPLSSFGADGLAAWLADWIAGDTGRELTPPVAKAAAMFRMSVKARPQPTEALMKALELITRAHRRVGVGDASAPLESAEAADGLADLNALIASLAGNGLGGRLIPIAASAHTAAQSGYVYHADTSAGSFTLTLPADPREGQMFGVADAQNRFPVHPLMIAPNGRLFEGSRGVQPLDGSQDRGGGTWFFRADTANWTRVRPLALTDEVFFAEDMARPLIWMLADEIASGFSESIRPDPMKVKEARDTFVRRYGRRGRAMSDPPISIQTQGAPRRSLQV
jgi:hypothetical protein